MRPLTCICMLMAAGSGLYLYQTKHRSQLLDREIAHTYKQIDQTRERITALRGEWALLGEPEQLGKLAQQHTGLKTLSPTQFVALADLGARLPAPLPPGAMPPPADDAVVDPGFAPAPAILAPAPIAVPIAAKPIAATPPRAVAEKAAEKPLQLASLPQPALPVAPPNRPIPRPAAAPPVTVAAVPPPPVPVTVLRQPATPAPVPPPAATSAPRFAAPVVAVSASPMPPARPQGGDGEFRSAAPPRPSPMIMSASLPQPSAPAGYNGPAGGIGSALGAAARVSLPAPVPFGAGQR